MTDNNHPITPPPELIRQWNTEAAYAKISDQRYIATQAARWGADTEMEACCEWLEGEIGAIDPNDLRAARRPKPPSLKAQALETLRSMQIEPCWINGINTNAELMSKYDTIRRALEQLDD